MSAETVAARSDGIHVRITNAPAGERLGFVPLNGAKPYVSESSAFLAKGPIWAIGPGSYDVRCLPPGTFNTNKVPLGPHITVVDPNHYWRSPDLDCAAADQVRIEPAPPPAGAVTQEDVIRAVVPGVLPTDAIDIAGYPQKYEGLGHRVVRDGQVLALVYMGEANDVAGGKECKQIFPP